MPERVRIAPLLAPILSQGREHMKESTILKHVTEYVNKCQDWETLNAIEELVKERKEQTEEIGCNFRFNDKNDNYLYVVDFDGEPYYLSNIGKKAWDCYMFFDRAYRIRRKTKDLFPTWEIMDVKGVPNVQSKGVH
jgi:hypothetical protein